MVDLEKLRRMTKEAQQRIADRKQKELAEEQAEETRKRRQEELKARMIVEQIDYRMETEANNGRNHAIIMNVNFERPKDFSGSYNVCKPEWLHGASVIVWNYCIEAGFQPTLESWWNIHPVERSGFNIVVHW